MSALGVDVARGGDDKTAFARLYGYWFDEIREVEGTDTPDGETTKDLILEHWEGDGTKGPPIGIDMTGGWGSSPYDLLRKQGYPVVAVIFSEESRLLDASGMLGFVNLRAEMWWKFREALDPKGMIRLALPPDQQLLADLCANAGVKLSNGILQ